MSSRIWLRAVVVLLAVLATGSAPPAFAAPNEVAVFAGGCFWCEESAFEDLPGVVSSVSGYAGGTTVNPSYEEVSTGRTGHAESAQVTFDPARISYDKLLDVYWHNIDPQDNDGQFCDKGAQYRSAIFYHDAEQRKLAEASKAVLQKRMKVYTDILPAGPFWPAEEYHQAYYKKNPVRYKFYRFNCGRDHRLEEVWGATAGH